MTSSLLSRFNEKKTTQAAAKFLTMAGGSMNYMVLIKFLYLLDRGALAKWGRAVTGAEYFSMKLGPVLSEVHDLITEPSEEDSAGFWARHISDASHFQIGLQNDPGDGELSQAEEDMIQSVYFEYERFVQSPFRLVDLLHQILPEWTKVASGRVALPISSILRSQNKSESEIEAIEEELSAVSTVRAMFAV